MLIEQLVYDGNCDGGLVQCFESQSQENTGFENVNRLGNQGPKSGNGTCAVIDIDNGQGGSHPFKRIRNQAQEAKQKAEAKHRC